MTPRIFLNYARGDDEPFVRRLYADLTARGFSVWFDRASMPSMRLTFHQEIKDAIRKDVDRMVHVAGPKAAASDNVREEWKIALELDLPVIPILRLGDYDNVPGELSLIHGEDFRDDGSYPAQLERLVANLMRPEPPLGALLGVPTLPHAFLARPVLLQRLKRALLVDLHKPVVVSGATGAGASVGLQGMGGIGKSVLAAAVARDRELRRAYPDGVAWVMVGQTPNIVQLQRDLGRRLGVGDAANIDDVWRGKDLLAKALRDRAILVVLDDVWDVQHAEAFTVFGPRGRVLITTRDARIVDRLAGESLPVSLFSEAEALELLAATATPVGSDPTPVSALPPEARAVARQGGFLPLAMALCGGMHREGTAWADMLAGLQSRELESFAQGQLRTGDNPAHASLWKAMLASILALDDAGKTGGTGDAGPETGPASSKKARFVELSAFAPDRRTPEAALATLWGHTGGLSKLASSRLISELASRSLVIVHRDGPDGSRCIEIHDLLHDCAARLAGDPGPLHEKLLEAYRGKCANGWPSGPNDGYFFEEIVRHLTLAKVERRDEARRLLLGYDWLRAKIGACGVQAAIDDYWHLAPDRLSPLGLARDALGLSAHVLRPRPEEVGTQLVGRLMGEEEPDLKALVREARDRTPRPCLMPAWPVYTAPGGPLLRTLDGHSAGVNSVALSADGRMLASGADDKAVKVWDAASGRLLRTLEGHLGWVWSVALSADGRTLASGATDRTVKVWDAASGQLLRTLEDHSGGVTSVALSADGTTLASGSEDKTVKVWDAASGRLLRTLEGHSDGVWSVALSADGTTLASGSDDRTVKVWDAASGRLLRTLEGHSGRVHSVVLSADGKTLASGWDDKTVKVWDAASGRLLRTLEGHSGRVTSVAFGAYGTTLASGSSDKTVKLWDAASGRLLQTLEGRSNEVRSVALSADGTTLASGSSDKTVKLWNAARERLLRTLEGHSDGVTSVALSADGKTLASGSWDKTFKLWDAASGRLRRTRASHSDGVMSLALSADGMTVACGSHSTVGVWDAANGWLLRTIEGHPGRVTSVALSADGKTLATWSWEKTVKLWDAASGRPLRAMEGHSDEVMSVALSADGMTVAGGLADSTVKVWDAANGRLLRTIEGHPDGVTSVALSADGKTLAKWSWDKTVELWDGASGHLLQTLKVNSGTVKSVALSADGKTLASGSDDNTVKFWAQDQGRPLASATCEAAVHAVAISPDGRRIATGDAGGRVYLFDVLLD